MLVRLSVGLMGDNTLLTVRLAEALGFSKERESASNYLAVLQVSNGIQQQVSVQLGVDKLVEVGSFELQESLQTHSSC